MNKRNKKIIKKLKIAIQLSKIAIKIPRHPWDYYYLGRECFNMEEPYRAAKYFMIAGRRTAKRGHKSLAITAFKEAKKIYQELIRTNPSILKRDDYGNLGTIDYYLDPFPEDAVYICVNPKFLIQNNNKATNWLGIDKF